MASDTNRSGKAASLLGRTGYHGTAGLASKLDTTRPTKGPAGPPAPLERARGGATKASDDDADDLPGRARGGRSPKHGGTKVNVIVAPQGGAHPPAPMGGPPLGLPPPHPPMGGPPPGGAPGGPPPGMPPGPPGMPPGAAGPAGPMPPPGMKPPGMKRGGGIGAKMDAGSGSGEGRKEKMRAYGKAK